MSKILLLALISITSVSTIQSMEKKEEESQSASKQVSSQERPANRGLRRSNPTQPAQEEARRCNGNSYKYVKSPIPCLEER